MRKNKITPEVKENIRAANALLSGNVQERCEKLKKQFSYCSVTLAAIIKDRRQIKVYDESPISHMERSEIVQSFLEKNEVTGMTYRIGLLMKKFNRSRVAINSIIQVEVLDKKEKYFDCKQEFHGMY